MLCITAKRNERVFIGDDVCLTLVRVEGGKVILGFDAPKSVIIKREKLFACIEAELMLKRIRGSNAAS